MGWLILFVLVGEVAFLHVLDVVADGIGHNGVEVGISAEELGREATGHAQHVSNHQNLSVASATGSDANHGNLQLAGNLSGQLGWNLLENYSEAPCVFQCVGIGDELLSLSLFLGTDGVGAEFVDGLGSQAEVSADGDACGENLFDCWNDFHATLKLEGIS